MWATVWTEILRSKILLNINNYQNYRNNNQNNQCSLCAILLPDISANTKQMYIGIQYRLQSHATSLMDYVPLVVSAGQSVAASTSVKTGI